MGILSYSLDLHLDNGWVMQKSKESALPLFYGDNLKYHTLSSTWSK